MNFFDEIDAVNKLLIVLRGVIFQVRVGLIEVVCLDCSSTCAVSVNRSLLQAIAEE